MSFLIDWAYNPICKQRNANSFSMGLIPKTKLLVYRLKTTFTYPPRRFAEICITQSNNGFLFPIKNVRNFYSI